MEKEFGKEMTHEYLLTQFDARCFDEVAELKKIFYSFFV